MNPLISFIICLFWIIFVIFSVIVCFLIIILFKKYFKGVSHFKVNLSTKKLFASDSLLLEVIN